MLLTILILFCIAFAVLSAIANNFLAFDCIIVGIFTAIYCSYTWELHPVFLILIFLAVSGCLYLLSRTAVGFWLVTIPSTAIWAIVAWSATESATKGDTVWMVFVSIVFGLIVFFLHIIHNKRFKGSQRSRVQS